ncbi:hypothetical protein ACIA5D_36635 [Actinoplanes sp. NPDC051513]|uniref:hypothetical protein n=1 Tax=Actinoplanes sp. NPDC051513 TaxID=3363908 RepID=UPI0037B2DBAB
MTGHDLLDWLKDLLGGQGITLVLILAAHRHPKPGRREVHAHVENNHVEITVGDPADGEAVVSALDEQDVTVDWTGDARDRIHIDV